MSKVETVSELNLCKCGEIPELIQWHDTSPKFTNATWIQCKCGMITVSFYSKNPQTAKNKAIAMWNKKSKRKKLKTGYKTCEKCGSADITVLKNEIGCAYDAPCETISLRCNVCGLCTDDVKEDGTYFTEKECKELWNK